ncbi:MAG: 4-(cytidine 5'-diphospho)-2-C-methyl-D-erythritol kinase [Verrucomicrobiota bacterium]|nr:4-(cytidine 5'-diphospho)-2-C-methyl-D-erythritol kinase [Verrucomicrobiota bacterium]
MEELAHAKVNLFLRVLRRRDDGFHEIETLLTPITLNDTVEIVSSDVFRFRCSDPSLSAGEDNLVVRAARAFFAATKLEPQVEITLSKRIPHGAGLGGGSSDAAATLRGLNRFCGANLSSERLQEIAATLGSDVPFFIEETTAICRGRGEIIAAAPQPSRFTLLLLKPAFSVPTPWAYSRWAEARELPEAKYAEQTYGDATFVNDLERPVFEKFPFLALLKNWLLAQPQVAVALMSGSGSTMFAVLRDRTSADALIAQAREELDPQLWAFACETVDRPER